MVEKKQQKKNEKKKTMGKTGKFILTSLIVGLIFGIGFYYSNDVATKCTIALAYAMFLIIYGMIVAPPKPTTEEIENTKGDINYYLETEKENES